MAPRKSAASLLPAEMVNSSLASRFMAGFLASALGFNAGIPSSPRKPAARCEHWWPTNRSPTGHPLAGQRGRRVASRKKHDLLARGGSGKFVVGCAIHGHIPRLRVGLRFGHPILAAKARGKMRALVPDALKPDGAPACGSARNARGSAQNHGVLASGRNGEFMIGGAIHGPFPRLRVGLRFGHLTLAAETRGKMRALVPDALKPDGAPACGSARSVGGTAGKHGVLAPGGSSKFVVGRAIHGHIPR